MGLEELEGAREQSPAENTLEQWTPAGADSQIWAKGFGPQLSAPNLEGLIMLTACGLKRRSQGSWLPGCWGRRVPQGPDRPSFRWDHRGLENTQYLIS